MESPELIAVRLRFGIGSLDNVDRWAEDVISRLADVDPVVYDILEADRETKAGLFFEFVRTQLGFECVSRQGTRYAEQILAELCEGVLRREMPVPRFCEVVRELDAAYQLPMEAGIPFPEGLSDLWNACDWCDGEWTLDDQPHLAEAIDAARRRLLERREARRQ